LGGDITWSGNSNLSGVYALTVDGSDQKIQSMNILNMTSIGIYK